MRRRYLRPRNSLKGSRYEGHYGPPLLQTLAEAWGLAPVERAALWRGLCHAAWSETVALREALIRFRPVSREAMHAFLCEVFTPAAVVVCLERLVQEQVLSRQLASRVEERLLRHTGADGRWQPQPPGGRETHTLITISVPDQAPGGGKAALGA
jgi:hypothetical protein